MIVCVCKGISDRAIRAALESGAAGADAVACATGAGTDCGCCRGTIDAMAARSRGGAHARNSPCSATPCPGCPGAERGRGAA